MARQPKNKNGNGSSPTLNTPQAVNAAIWSVCDILRRSNCAGALQYVPELTWLLFLRILDEQEQHEAETAEIVGEDFQPSLNEPYRWRDWAAPYDETGEHPPVTAIGSRRGWLRRDRQNQPPGSFFAFVNGQLLPHLRSLARQPNATPRQKVISQILSSVERARVDTERNFADVLDKLDPIRLETTDPQHVFILSQVYEGLLLRMGEKGNDGGQFFTPRQVIKAMVEVIQPRLGETVYDPSCGTGGFLAQAYQYLHQREVKDNPAITPDQIDRLKHATFFGREKENLIYPIALANLMVHGIDRPNLWHGNTLTGDAAYDRLFDTAPAQFDVILTNPPFGGKEGTDAQKLFDFKTSATQMLFLQHILSHLKDGGRCGIVLDEGVLFRTNETAFVQIKRKLLDDCDLWCIVSLPGGVFTAAGAGVKTNLLFFTKGQPTTRIWYYDLSALKVAKRQPLIFEEHFKDFIECLPERRISDRSWSVDFAARQRHAAETAAPFKVQAQQKTDEANIWKARLNDLKRQSPRDPAAETEAHWRLRRSRLRPVRDWRCWDGRWAGQRRNLRQCWR
ncbi:MAG: N-6 DNA methylase [Synechococcaceae cyanobacterium SM1_2_3]|nr:N-6 DNA methylase [Synechococcaceae cyanobacterium SM1_2_3]